MISKPDTNTINNALEQICTHPLFANSSVYTRLLRYLVEKALANEDIKEYTIGNDLFGKNYLDDKNDGTVRTYMYKLRKKLTEYYEDKSRAHDVIFEIKKGQYNLNFVSEKEFFHNAKEVQIHIPLRYLKIFSIVIISLAVGYIITKTLLNEKPPIWQNYLKKDAQNMVIISDQYMLMEKNQYGELQATMNKEINSDKDFFEYQKIHPEHKIESTDFTMMSKMAPYSVKILDDWFHEFHRNFDLQLESMLSFDDMRTNNTIFVGQFKTMNISQSLFLKNSRYFTTYKDGFKYSKDGDEIIYNTQFKVPPKVEYAMVSFSSFHPGKNALYFVSNNDVGVMATLRKFVDKEFLKEFSEKLPSKHAYFNALFKVEGIERTDISCELVELEVLELKYLLKFNN